MRLFLFLFLPIVLFAQEIHYPDTVVNLKGRTFPCLVANCSEANITFTYKNKAVTYLGFDGLKRVYVDQLGEVLNNDNSRNYGPNTINNFIKLRDENNNLVTSDFPYRFNWEIKLLNGTKIKSVSLIKCYGDSLYLFNKNRQFTLNVDSIQFMVFDIKSKAVNGLLPGILCGAVSGFVYKKFIADNKSKGAFTPDQQKYAAGGAVAGGVLGMAIGFGLSGDKYYNIERRAHDEKIIKIKELIAKF